MKHFFIEKDIEKNKEFYKEFVRYGWRVVPIFVINNITVVKGFDPVGLARAISGSA